jgi:hypothetical protein
VKAEAECNSAVKRRQTVKIIYRQLSESAVDFIQHRS